MKNLTDEQLDLVLQKILQDSALDSESLSEIVDSPNILWNIKREINQQKEQKQKGWIWDFRWLVPTFVSMSLLIVLGLFWVLSSNKNDVVADVKAPKLEIEELKAEKTEISRPEIIQSVDSTENNQSTKNFNKQNQTKSNSVKLIQTKPETKNLATPKLVQTKAKIKRSTKNTENSEQEYKTEFISLSYLPTPESGQIVRVKVPRAMMVSLGVTNNVSKNDEMVNAEIIVGDDGTNRAIRFISDSKK